MAEVSSGQSKADARPFTEGSARSALSAACEQVGLDAERVDLIRMGSNAVFRVADGIARVAPSSSLLANAEKQIEVARWLDEVDYPATRALQVRQPVEAEGRVVTFWESVSGETTYAPNGEVAGLIKRLHALDPPAFELPELRPFGEPQDGLPQFPGLSPDDEQFLRSRIEWARETFPLLPFALPRGHIHGDANVGNVICDEDGRAVLIDLDSFANGPREWDLIQTALFVDRFGWHSGDEYRTFVEVYGYDITQWDGYAELADIREVSMTSWLGSKAATSKTAAREASKRIEAIRTGGSRRNWGPY